eukprot:PhM_4_TR14812/c0_g1_i3/m.33735
MSKQKEPQHDAELAAAIAALPGDDTELTWEKCKAVGNLAFSKSCYITSIKYYTSAINKLKLVAEEGSAQAVLDEAVLMSNRSAAYLGSTMVSGPSMAIKDARRCVELRPQWFKAHTRLGDALYKKKEYDDAKASYENALKAAEAQNSESVGTIQNIKSNIALCENALRGESSAGSMPPPPPPPGGADGKKESEYKEWVFESVEDVQKVRGEPLDEVEESRTAFRKFGASVEEADREAAQSYKRQLFDQFRQKKGGSGSSSGSVPSTSTLAGTHSTSGDYSRYNIDNFAKVDKSKLPSDYSHGTDYIGKVISNDAMKGGVGGTWGDVGSQPKFKK